MQLSTSFAIRLVAALLLSTAPLASATIRKGTAHYDSGNQDQAVWIEGADPCQYTYMGPATDNLCEYNGGQFTATNGYTYRFVGCGGNNFSLLNSDSTPNSKGKSDSFRAASNCNNNQGHYYVQAEWKF